MKDFKSLMNYVESRIEKSTHTSEYEEEGKIVKCFGDSINGKKEGKWIGFRKGELVNIVEFKNGKIHGEAITYTDGEVSVIANFKNDLQDGLTTDYYKGLKISETEYLKDKKISSTTISEEEFKEKFPNITIDDI